MHTCKYAKVYEEVNRKCPPIGTPLGTFNRTNFNPLYRPRAPQYTSSQTRQADTDRHI